MDSMIKEFVEPGHFYSVIPPITNEYQKHETTFLGLDFNEQSHLDILKELPFFLSTFDKEFGHKEVAERQQELKYTLLNGAFEWMDARLLHYFLQKKETKKDH